MDFKYKKHLIIVDKVISVLVVVLLGIFRPDVLMITMYFMLFPYFLLTSRKSILKHLGVASVVSLIWMIFGKNYYGYNQDMLTIFGINTFPLFAWALGLFAAYLLYSHWEYKVSGPVKKMILFVFIYIPLLILVETIAYHVFNIQNVQNAAYVGLPLCDCIHAPRWMQILYLLLGPIYFFICELIGLENPHGNIDNKF